MKKSFILLAALLAISSVSFGQFYKSLLPSPEFTSAIEKIVLDFRDDYRSVQGELVDTQGEVETYESMVKLPGVLSCKILRFHSKLDTTASWQAIVYAGEDFKEAARAYENTFRLVKKSNLRWIDRSSVGFAGVLESPRDDLRFTTSTLSLQLTDDRYKDYQAEVVLQNTFVGWEVQLNLGKKYVL